MTAQSQPENVRLGEDGESVVLLDQTRLPGRVEYRTVRDLKEMVEAIRTLRVRGAPAIGVFAGFCLSALARQMERAGLDTPGLLRELDRKGKILVSSRPTAVNLSWAVERMMDRASGLAGGAPEELAAALEAESRAIRRAFYRGCWHVVSRHFLVEYRHYLPQQQEFTIRRPSSSTRRRCIRVSPIVQYSPLLPPVGVWAVSQSQCGRSTSQSGYRSLPWWAVTSPTS